MKKHRKIFIVIACLLLVCFIFINYSNIKFYDVTNKIKNLKYGNAIKKITYEEGYDALYNQGPTVTDYIHIDIRLFKGKCTDDEVTVLCEGIKNIIDEKFNSETKKNRKNRLNISFSIEPVSEKVVNGFDTNIYSYFREYDLGTEGFIWTFCRVRRFP